MDKLLGPLMVLTGIILINIANKKGAFKNLHFKLAAIMILLPFILIGVFVLAFFYSLIGWWAVGFAVIIAYLYWFSRQEED